MKNLFFPIKDDRTLKLAGVVRTYYPSALDMMAGTGQAQVRRPWEEYEEEEEDAVKSMRCGCCSPCDKKKKKHPREGYDQDPFGQAQFDLFYRNSRAFRDREAAYQREYQIRLEELAFDSVAGREQAHFEANGRAVEQAQNADIQAYVATIQATTPSFTTPRKPISDSFEGPSYDSMSSSSSSSSYTSSTPMSTPRSSSRPETLAPMSSARNTDAKIGEPYDSQQARFRDFDGTPFFSLDEP